MVQLSTRASGAGRRKASGRRVFKAVVRTIPISNTSFIDGNLHPGPSAWLPAQKGDVKSGHRQVARRPDDEDCSARRRARQSGALRASCRVSVTTSPVLMFSWTRSSLCPGSHRRQGIRCWLGCASVLAQRRHAGYLLSRCARWNTMGETPRNDAEKYQWRHLIENFLLPPSRRSGASPRATKRPIPASRR